MLQGLRAQPCGSAYERVTFFVKTKQAVGGASDTDADALADDDFDRAAGGGLGAAGCSYRLGGDGPSGLARAGPCGRKCAEPERAGRAEVDAVEGAVNPESGGETAGATGQVRNFCGAAVRLHLGDALQGVQRADEYAATYSGDLRADVQHEMVAITEIDIGVTAAKEHGAGSRSRPDVVVGGGVAYGIGLDLHDAATEASRGQLANDDLADEKTRKGFRIDG